MKILTFVNYYLPGYKAGGPIRTIANMVAQLGDQLDFWILTADRDAQDSVPYEDIVVDDWNSVGKAKVYYASPGAWSLRNIRRLVSEISPGVVYLNSFFSTLTMRYLVLRYLKLVPPIPVVLAPRGEFSSGALQIHALKKRVYLLLTSFFGFYKRLLWQASSSKEKVEIESVMGDDIDVCIAPNIPYLGDNNLERIQKITKSKKPGSVRFIFLSRVSPKKNLDFLLKILPLLSGNIVLDIYGSISDRRYWRKCNDIIQKLPPHVQVTYCDQIPHERVFETLKQYHFFVLPTLGENFGHAILESLSVGCPVVISDQTPWSNLEDSVSGWSISLKALDLWREVLQLCVNMDDTRYTVMSGSAREFALKWGQNSRIIERNLDLFRREVFID